MGGKPAIRRRKAEHVAVAASGAANFTVSTLLEDVHFMHQSLPECSASEIDLETPFVGKLLSAPILITGMTGGYPGARKINRGIAAVCDKMGIAFGVGSQRAMVVDPDLANTYEVRDVAPRVALLANLGAVQLRDGGVDIAIGLANDIDADGIAIHLNPAQELIQRGGDRDFRLCLEAIAQLVLQSPIPVIVKETGAGLSARACRMLKETGVKWVDVSGAGGTSWTAVEAKRAQDAKMGNLGHLLWDWGIPTAVTTAMAADEGLQVIASGGLRDGFDAARAFGLGATIAGYAGEALRAFRQGGEAELSLFIEALIQAIRSVCLLTASKTPSDLFTADKRIAPGLAGWLTDVGIR